MQMKAFTLILFAYSGISNDKKVYFILRIDVTQIKLHFFQPLKDFVWNCLYQATEDNMQTIAFPAIGTGNLKYPKEGVAETMINTVHEFSDKCPTTLQSVFFVIFDDATLQVYHCEYEIYFIVKCKLCLAQDKTT